MQISSSFSNGRISCSFIRSVLAANVSEDRNLNEAAFVLLAFGSMRGMRGPYTDYFLFTTAVIYSTSIVCSSLL